MRPIMMTVLLYGLTSCTSLMAAKQQSLPLARPQSYAYACAKQTMIAMGCTDLRTDTQGGIVSGTIHGAIQLTAQVTPEGTGSRIDVTGTPIPGKIAVGKFHEVDTYLAKVQECQ